MIYINRNNYTNGIAKEIQTNRVSETIPDQSYSMKELLTRFTRGGQLKMLTPQLDDDDPEISDAMASISNMDKMEKLENLHAVKQTVGATRKKIMDRLDNEKMQAEQVKDTPDIKE